MLQLYSGFPNAYLPGRFGHSRVLGKQSEVTDSIVFWRRRLPSYFFGLPTGKLQQLQSVETC